MLVRARHEDTQCLAEGLNFAQKVDRSLGLIREAYEEYGDRLVAANSLGKDSVAVWHLAKRVSADIRGFIVTTRFKPKQTVEFMNQMVSRPILIWYEREVWQYLALHQVPVNPLYGKGYRSLGCKPCTRISNGPDERAGRWMGTSKCGGECGIHTRPLRIGYWKPRRMPRYYLGPKVKISQR